MKRKNIDETIHRQLFVNPSLSIGVCFQIKDKLKGMSLAKKKEMMKELVDNMNVFQKRVKEANGLSDELAYSELCNQAVRHIRSWESAFGQVGLKDIKELANATGLKLADIMGEHFTPADIAELLSDYIIGQTDYVRMLSLCIYSHRLKINSPGLSMPKANLLVYGPSGTGKTYALQVLARQLGLHIGVIHANSVVQEGIVGPTLSDVFTRIYLDSGRNLEAVEQAVIFVDEFDKLFADGHYNKRILQELLSMIDDDSTIQFRDELNSKASTLTVSCRNMLFIFSGVFEGLRSIVTQRLGAGGIGFGRTGKALTEADIYRQAEMQDFKQLFQRSELAGRIMQYVAVRPLSTESFLSILLEAKESPFLSFRNYFERHDIDVELTADGAQAIVAYVTRLRLGVRGLKSTLWKVLSAEMQRVGTCTGHRTITINKEYVINSINH